HVAPSELLEPGEVVAVGPRLVPVRTDHPVGQHRRDRHDLAGRDRVERPDLGWTVGHTAMGALMPLWCWYPTTSMSSSAKPSMSRTAGFSRRVGSGYGSR